ncbi:phospho-sugar mutase [Corynebacterium bovis]|uniref:phospho-sugar mutase n=1 Tax=Corynebacterium bovis TaxID=36808 RepID=UPI000F64E289|nr:phospho-sugar mutase [Corynebacterium bovis]RRO79341.1 phosphomannomutase [Corynebacterium bovis]RRO79510.1 phosphomannomutase [Corynebacterium bovis]
MTGLRFGTAGLRAPVGPGPDHMNVSTVSRATAGVAQWLREHATPLREGGPFAVAVGFDSRYGSHAMALATAQVFAGAGFDVTLLAEPTPTPVLAWVVRDRGLDAGVQITASHNPKADNGYKLYLAGGSQIVPPADREIEAAVAAQPSPAWRIPRAANAGLDHGAREGYVAAVAGLEGTGDAAVLAARRTLRIAYTPLHGVGGSTLEEVLRSSGFGSVTTVPSQRWPDPEFPTVEFPNPEEAGATDALVATAGEVGADLLIALDPDADRCMIGVPDPQAPGGYRMLRGDETGPLLARRVLSRYRPAAPAPTPTDTADGPDAAGAGAGADAAPVVATTIVSSGLLAAMAEAEGWDHRETLTGFKYLARAADDRPGELVFAYEEAVGTCPAPDLVADKDGIATALVAAAWAAELAAEGRTLRDELEDLDATYGVYRTAQVAVRTAGPEEAAALVREVTDAPPASLAGVGVTAAPLAGTAGVRLTGEDGGVAVRVIARPSGTEPKAKFYLQVSAPTGADAAHVEAVLDRLTADVRGLAPAV